MNPKRSFGSIGNPAIRPIEFPFLFCFRPARCRGKFNKSKPNIFGKPTRRISNVHSSSDRSTINFSLFCKWICWFYIFSVYKTWRKRFRVDTYVLTFRSFEPWLRDSRWSNLCFLILCTGHNAFYILFSIHLIFLFLAYILIFHFIHLYYCTVWIFMFLWHSTPAYLLYFICIVFLIFALMAGIISYVCAFSCMYILFTPFTCVIDQTGCRRENGTEPVIASARCPYR